MTEMKLRLRKENLKMEAKYFTSAEKDGFDVKNIHSDKGMCQFKQVALVLESTGLMVSLFSYTGRGVFSCVHFDKEDFVSNTEESL